MWRTSVATSMAGRSDEQQIEVTLQPNVGIRLRAQEPGNRIDVEDAYRAGTPRHPANSPRSSVSWRLADTGKSAANRQSASDEFLIGLKSAAFAQIVSELEVVACGCFEVTSNTFAFSS
jgi:hypothetical protein